MSQSIYGIGLSGLAAAQAGLLTAGHNIANVNTPGYTRQQALFAARPGLFTGVGFVGQGVDVTTVQRIYSNFAVTRTLQSQASSTEADAKSNALSDLDALFGDGTSGLNVSMDAFFASVNAVSLNPADAPSRQQLLSSAQSLVSSFQSYDQQMTAQRTSVNQQISNTVDTVNGYAKQLASLNQRIAAQTGNGQGKDQPNDLLDQRDALVSQINAQIGVTPVVQSDNSFNLFLSNGQALVIGSTAQTLVAAPGTDDPQNMQIGLANGSGVLNFASGDLTGGALSGLLTFRDTTLNSAQNELGRVAIVLGDAFNAQHALGVDLNGNPGAAFFSVGTPTVQAATTNTGTGVVASQITNASALVASDYTLRFDGTNYALTRESDGTTTSYASLPQMVDGMTISLASGAMAAGDRFRISPTAGGASGLGVAITDPAAVAAATPIRTAASATNVGNASLASASVSAGYPAAPLASPLTLTYNAGAATLSGFPAAAAVTVTVNGVPTTYPPATPVPYTTGATVSFDNMSFVTNGTPANGDTFSVAPNGGGAGDNSNAQLLAALAQAQLVGGTTSLDGAYGQLVARVGTDTNQAGIEQTAQATILTQAQAAQQSISGVNLDEEAANLQQFQQAYQAASKLMAIASTLFNSVLAIMA
ncbi:MAG TPA: flagellar hook-associated protein FlgK [Casimicrobiaceae bacterium]